MQVKFSGQYHLVFPNEKDLLDAMTARTCTITNVTALREGTQREESSNVVCDTVHVPENADMDGLAKVFAHIVNSFGVKNPGLGLENAKVFMGERDGAVNLHVSDADEMPGYTLVTPEFG